MCKAAWGWGADGSERFLFLELRVPSCAGLLLPVPCSGAQRATRSRHTVRSRLMERGRMD